MLRIYDQCKSSRNLLYVKQSLEDHNNQSGFMSTLKCNAQGNPLRTSFISCGMGFLQPLDFYPRITNINHIIIAFFYKNAFQNIVQHGGILLRTLRVNVWFSLGWPIVCWILFALITSKCRVTPVVSSCIVPAPTQNSSHSPKKW